MTKAESEKTAEPIEEIAESGQHPETVQEPIEDGATIGKLTEAEYRFASGARLQVAENALVGWVPEEDDEAPYRWRVVSSTDEVMAEGGCQGGYDALTVAHSALTEAAASYEQVVKAAHGEPPRTAS